MLLNENLKEDFISVIREIAEKDDRDKPRYFIKFSAIEKFTPSPSKYDPDTPYGIFGFPIGIYKNEFMQMKSYEDFLKIMINYEPEPHFIYKLYAYIFTYKPGSKIWYLKQNPIPSEINVKEYLEKFFEYIEENFMEDWQTELLKNIRNEKYKTFYGVLQNTIYDVLKFKYSDTQKISLAFTKFLRKFLGYDGIVDNIGYEMTMIEKYQGVFFDPQKLKIIKFLYNPQGKQLHNMLQHAFVRFIKKNDLTNDSFIKSNADKLIYLLDRFLEYARSVKLDEYDKKTLKKLLTSDMDAETKIALFFYYVIDDLSKTPLFDEEHGVLDKYLYKTDRTKWLLNWLKFENKIDPSISAILKSMIKSYVLTKHVRVDWNEIEKYLETLPAKERERKTEELRKTFSHLFH